MKKIFMIIIAAAAILIAAAILYGYGKRNRNVPKPQANTDNSSSTVPATTEAISNFDQCAKAGHLLTGTKPNRHCIVSKDLVYIEIESCGAPTGESMTIYDAQHAFDSSQCGLEGSAKDNHACDETAGTWIIGIQTFRKNCDPACVINVVTKKAAIDWRCASTTKE